MRFSLRNLMCFTAIVAIQLAIPKSRIPLAIAACTGLIFILFILSLLTCVYSTDPNGEIAIKNNRRLMVLLRGLAFTMICFLALFFNSVLRGLLM